MSDFSGMEELLQDFLTEASELLSGVDNKLVGLEKTPDDKALLNDIFRGFHTIKGGAGFLNATELVALCHRTENLFDKLRNSQLVITAEIMDTIMHATGVVRDMFGSLSQHRQPETADPSLLSRLDAAIDGRPLTQDLIVTPVSTNEVSATPSAAIDAEIDWALLYSALTGVAVTSAPAAMNGAQDRIQTRETTPEPPQKSPPQAMAAPKETTIRIDTARLDQVLNLSGEIGLTKNRLNCLRTDILQGRTDANTLRALDEAVGQLDLLVGDLQSAVMKTRMQPIGRLFQKYPRLARDLARQLGKDIELVLVGEETELDKTMIEDLNDPLVHLVRNAVDHGIEDPDGRKLAGKQSKSLVKLSARQEADNIIIEISDDGRGMRPDVIRNKAIEKGLIDQETANTLDDRQCLNLIFLPGFSTKDEISSVSGRGVGMDVVKTNIQRLNGRIDVTSVVGTGSIFTIHLPLTMAILPVLVVRVGLQPFAVPLSMVREIIPIRSGDVKQISGRATMVIREEIVPVKSLASLLDWPDAGVPSFGVLMQSSESSFIMAIDSYVGRDDVVIKPLVDIKPDGVAGATMSGDGSIVLVLDMEDLLRTNENITMASLFQASN